MNCFSAGLFLHILLILAHQNWRFRLSYYYQGGIIHCRVASTLVNSSQTTGQIYFKFGKKHPCGSHIWMCYYCANWPLLGATIAKNRKTIKDQFPLDWAYERSLNGQHHLILNFFYYLFEEWQANQPKTLGENSCISGKVSSVTHNQRQVCHKCYILLNELFLITVILCLLGRTSTSVYDCQQIVFIIKGEKIIGNILPWSFRPVLEVMVLLHWGICTFDIQHAVKYNWWFVLPCQAIIKLVIWFFLPQTYDLD